MKTVALIAMFLTAGCSAPSSHLPPLVEAPAPPSKKAEPPTPPTQDTAKPANASNPLRTFQLKDLMRVEVQVGDRKIPAWVMDNDAKRGEGMMWLSEGDVKPEEGMLFVFRDAAPRSFWMRNTYIPLDIAYIGPQGLVLNVVRGKPLDESQLPSKGAARYVLELKAGQAKELGVTEGAVVKVPATVRARD